MKELDDILDSLQTNERGLSNEEAEKRINEYGYNELPESPVDSLFTIFIDQFKNPLIYILLLACAVVFLMGGWVDAIVILIVLIFNAIIGSFQEGKAQNTLFALKSFVETTATVLRDDKEIILSDKKIVPGDIIIIQEGEKIPADARIITSNTLKIDEATMTGESKPIYKDDNNHNLLKGTYVVSGNGTAVVTATGEDTSIGKIANKISEINTEIPLKNNISLLSKVIVGTVIILSIAIFFVGIYHSYSIEQMILAIVALDVSLIPEGLPVVITLILATGVWEMSKKNALVKKLQAVEALGQANIIAVDKTGTITKNELVIKKTFINNKFYEIEGIGYDSKGNIKTNNDYINPVDDLDLVFLAKLSSLCAEAKIVYSEKDDIWKISGDPTEAAVLVFGKKVGFCKDRLTKEYPKIEDHPFDYKNKYRSSLHKFDGKKSLITMGSPESVLFISDKIWKNGKSINLSSKGKELLKINLNKLLNEGLRVIALAKDNTFIGFLGMKDDLRPGVSDSVKKAQDAGVKVVMITGDHKITAKSIAKEAGIYFRGDKIITGKELEDLTDSQVLKILNKVSIFARVNPEHKLRIVNLFKSQGKIIAMTGDGVNDAPSLVAADLGISMGKIGTEVAKEASDIILLDDNFGTIVSAIEEGRGIYQSIKKVILYLLSTGATEAFVILVALLIGLPLPLLAVQIIWLNFVTDGILDVTLAMDPKEKNLLKKKFKKPNKFFVDKLMIKRIIIFSFIMGFSTLLLFKHYFEIDMTKAMTMTLTVLAVFQWFNVWNCRSETKSIFNKEMFSNKFLILGTIAVALLQLTAIYNPFMQEILKTTALSAQEWILIVSVASSVIIIEEIRKLFVRIKST